MTLEQLKKQLPKEIRDDIPDDVLLKSQKAAELEKIAQWFIQNDWKVNKVFIGEWDINDPRYQSYLKDRAEKRARQDELKGE